MANLTEENVQEILLDKIADSLIGNINLFSQGQDIQFLRDNQKTIRNGIIQLGRDSTEKLVLYETDVDANKDDLETLGLADVLNNFIGYESDTILVTYSPNDPDSANDIFIGIVNNGSSQVNITGYLANDDNPFNVSQFLSIEQLQTNVQPDDANEYLNTNIYELLPTERTRQERINDFFKEYEILKGNVPQFDDYDGDGSIEAEGGYSTTHDISWFQSAGELTDNSFITRLNIDANSQNVGYTLQSLRDDVNQYLKDIDQIITVESIDDRPEYENKSEGYLKIRNLNDGIVIRKQEGDEVGLEKLVAIDAGVVGPTDSPHPHENKVGPSYLMDGFAITMWVRFLDKNARGTLFNYGNPTRQLDPKGFKLETFVLNRDDVADTHDIDGQTWGDLAAGTDIFSNYESERFIRLVVYDHTFDSGYKQMYDSRLGITGLPKNDLSVPEFGVTNANTDDHTLGYEKNLLGHVRVPIDFDEWFFIVASFNPLVDDTSEYNSSYAENPDYWGGHINPNTTSGTYYSGLGNKCKVEIISRSDLLRARGYKV